MYSNADTFIGSIECLMCGAVINPISQPTYVSGGEVWRTNRWPTLLSPNIELVNLSQPMIYILDTKLNKKEKDPENTIYMCSHNWCTFSLRMKDKF